MNRNLRVAIIGKGNVGSHLEKAFILGKGIEVSLLDSRTLKGLKVNYDFILITVSDSAIKTVAKNISDVLPDFRGIIAHTSGSVPMEILKSYFNKYGVFYPLQTFTKGIDIPFYQQIPIFIEGSTEGIAKELEFLAKKCFADHTYRLSSELRSKLHLASIFACNFTNAMYVIAEKILAEENLPFNVLRPLISLTTQKVMKHAPLECQTGPARRGELKILEQHLTMLKRDLRLSHIYSLISNYIASEYNNQIL